MHTVDEETSKKDTKRLWTVFYFERKEEKRAGAETITTSRSLSGKTGNLIEILFRTIVHSNEIVRPIEYEQSAVCRLVRQMRQRKNKRRRQEKSRARISHVMSKLLDVKESCL